jgi:arylformamidase
MKLVDLSHIIEENMPVYPGTEPPILLEANTVARDHFAEKKITMYSHTGTHMDAPAHMLEKSKTLDAYGIGSFFGKAVLVDFSHSQAPYIDVATLLPLEKQLKQARFCILRTGWAERWGRPDYFEGFPAFSPEAARWLIHLGILGIGTDAISIDRMEDDAFPVHHILFNAEAFVIENLTNLSQVGSEFNLACFPLRIKNADGSPVRAVAWVED